MRDLRRDLWREVVQILVDRIAGVNLVLNAIETGHQHRSESQVGIGGRIRETHFDAAPLGVADVRDPARCRAILRGVGEVDRRLETGNQPLVRVGTWISDGIERFRVLDHAADVEQREFGKACVTVPRKDVLAALPYRLVHVHARTVVADDRLRHERCRLAVGVRDHPDRVLEDLIPVGALDQGVELGADLVLPRGRHFVVEHLHFDALFFQRQRYRVTNVLQLVDGRHGKVAALDARTVAHVAAFVFLARGPRGFFGFDFDAAAGHVRVPGDGIENEKFGFGSEVSGVPEAGRLEVGLGPLRE